MVSPSRYQFRDVEGEALLLVEGADDARFFNAFLRQLNLCQVQIASVNGVNNFAPFLKNTLVTARGYPNLRRLALVRDADSDAQAAYQSLRSALSGADLPVPPAPFQVSATGQPYISLAILPDGKSCGNLEDLCLRSIGDASALQCVDTYVACRNPVGISAGALSKAKLHTYLAVADEPGRRLGEAADAGVWNWNSSALRHIAAFLSQLGP